MVMCVFVGFGIYAKISDRYTFKQELSDFILLALISCLFVVVIIGIIFSIYYHWLGSNNKKIDHLYQSEDRYRQVIIQEMGEFDPNLHPE